jgi:tetratricopeptide (TPR) repeat protein
MLARAACCSEQRSAMKIFARPIIAALLMTAGAAAMPMATDHAMPAMKMIDPMPAVYMGQADVPGAPVFRGLGTHRHRITTRNRRTQVLFDQGVRLLFGFNHAEAIRSFREAARLDPRCAMCWWGVAFALGSNINLPMPTDAAKPAWEALQNAVALKRYANAEERDWIDALATRYTADRPKDRAGLDENFAQAMGALWRKYPRDLDAGVFYAEAMMDTQPWAYWGTDGETPLGHAATIVAVLEDIIKRAPSQPGALHLYIHAVEGSTRPERAEVAADRLETLMPGAGHIVHMPSHIYYRVGRFADAVTVNERAALVDEQYIAACHAQGFYPVGYYGHNIHFLWTSSEMLGRYQASIDAARRLVKAVGPDAVKQNYGVQLFLFTPDATLLRFGKWDAILAEPMPAPDLKLDLVITHQARGFAYANKGDKANALTERGALAALVDDTALAVLAGIPAKQMAEISLAELDGEIARTSGDINTAIADYTRAQTIEQSLPYTEPPYWHQPVANLLGALLLQAGRPEAAAAVYRESLMTYRLDGWSLYGLALAQDAMGQHQAAAATRKQFATAWQLADVTLTASRF